MDDIELAIKQLQEVREEAKRATSVPSLRAALKRLIAVLIADLERQRDSE